MTKKKYKLQEIIIFILITFLSLLSIILILTDANRPNYYNMLWILPFIYMLFFVIVWIQFPNFIYKISACIILSIYGTRMVIVPLVMSLGNYSTYGQVIIIEEYMELALLLMCWEFVVISLFIVTKYWKKNKYIKGKSIEIDSFSRLYENGLPKKIKLFIFLLFLYIVLILIGTPGLLKESFFLTTGRTEESYALYFSGTASHNAFGLSFGPQLVTVAFTFFWILQALLPPYLLARISVLIKSKYLRNVLFWVVLLGTMMIATEGRAHSIESALALLLTTSYALKTRFKFNPKILLILIIGVTVYGLSHKSGVAVSNENFRNEFSLMLSAYISGPQNVATAIAASNQSSSLGLLNVVTDFLQRIPYIAKYFTNIFGGTSNVIFNQFFGPKNLGQIIPSIGLGYSYFGFIFAPIIPLIAAWFSLLFEKKAQASPDLIKKNFFYLGVIMMARATAMSSMLSGVIYLGNMFLTWIVVYIGFLRLNKNHQSRGG